MAAVWQLENQWLPHVGTQCLECVIPFQAEVAFGRITELPLNPPKFA